MFGKGRFTGARRVLTGPTRLENPFVMKSVEIGAGSQWEFCSGKTYTGCRQVAQSDPATVMTVRSARPVGALLVAGELAPAPQPGQRGGGASLRGVASEFFVAPDDGGNRVEVPAGTAEATTRRAIEFCRARGWRASPHSRLQTIGGRYYLVDLLCSDSGV
jgi:hypothetical protein